MATVTVTKLSAGKFLGGPGMKAAVLQIGLTGNYTTGGEIVLPEKAGMKRFDLVLGHINGHAISFDYANNKVLLYESGTADAILDELDATTLPAATTNTLRLLVVGV